MKIKGKQIDEPKWYPGDVVVRRDHADVGIIAISDFDYYAIVSLVTGTCHLAPMPVKSLAGLKKEFCHNWHKTTATLEVNDYIDKDMLSITKLSKE